MNWDAIAVAYIFLSIAFSVLLFLAIQNPCVYEDSTMCYWDARQMGNGMGNSFVDIKLFKVYY